MSTLKEWQVGSKGRPSHLVGFGGMHHVPRQDISDLLQIAIITFKQPFLLERIFQTFKRHGWPPCKVRVFEDYPVKRWPNEQDEHRITDIKVAYRVLCEQYNVYLHEAKEWGCCHRMAQCAVQTCSSEWVMILSDDVLPTPGCISNLIGLLETYSLPDVGAIQIPYWNVDDLLVYHPELLRSRMHPWWDSGLLDRIPENPWWTNQCFLYDYDGTQPIALPSPYATVHATGFLLRKSVWEQVGRFDDRLAVYDEDISFKIWMKTPDKVVIRVPGPPLVHIHGTSTYSGFPEDTLKTYDGQRLKAKCWAGDEEAWDSIFPSLLAVQRERSQRWTLS